IDIKSSIREIISHQVSIDSSLKQLASIQGILPFNKISTALHRPTLQNIKRDVKRLKPEQRRKLSDWLRSQELS
ncbi:MAG: hypothetical protein M3362_02405, partial [Acidobacteriota bacterium]|nr:hypothetical protein [Acidobacteriota bacterium]